MHKFDDILLKVGHLIFATGAAVAFAIYKRIKKHASTPELDEGIGDVDSIVSETEVRVVHQHFTDGAYWIFKYK